MSMKSLPVTRDGNITAGRSVNSRNDHTGRRGRCTCDPPENFNFDSHSHIAARLRADWQ